MRPIKAYAICPYCSEEFMATVYPHVPAKIYGDPNDCYPEEPPELDPTECPHCQMEFSHEATEVIMNQVAKENEDTREFERE